MSWSAVAPRTGTGTATVRDECLAKMEKAFSLRVENMNRTCALTDRNELYQTAPSLCGDVSKGSPETSDTTLFTASKQWFPDSGMGFY